MVDTILEDDTKIDLQRAVDLACFVKNTEINKTGFSSMQIFCVADLLLSLFYQTALQLILNLREIMSI